MKSGLISWSTTVEEMEAIGHNCSSIFKAHN